MKTKKIKKIDIFREALDLAEKREGEAPMPLTDYYYLHATENIINRLIVHINDLENEVKILRE